MHSSRNKNIIIQKADRHNTIVILDKASYMKATEATLHDHTKFSNLEICTGKEITYITNLEKKITGYWKMK